MCVLLNTWKLYTKYLVYIQPIIVNCHILNYSSKLFHTWAKITHIFLILLFDISRFYNRITRVVSSIPTQARWVLDTTLCYKVCQWLMTGRWFSAGIPVSSTNKIDCHDITEILLKVALNTINQPPQNNYWFNISMDVYIITCTTCFSSCSVSTVI